MNDRIRKMLLCDFHMLIILMVIPNFLLAQRIKNSQKDLPIKSSFQGCIDFSKIRSEYLDVIFMSKDFYQSKYYTNLSNRTEKMNLSIEYGRPPLHLERVLLELLIGGTCGVLGGVVGGMIGFLIDVSITRHSSEFGGLGGFLIGGSLGLTLGSTGGVYSVGHYGDETGSFWATFGGSVFGFLMSYFIHTDIGNDGPKYLLIGTPICATVGFNMTRRYKEVDVSEKALFNIHGCRIKIDFPKMYRYQNYTIKNYTVHRYDLIKLNFN